MTTTALLNGLTFGALLMVLASGLAMMYGLRGVMNFAHGALYMFGAYFGYSIAGATNFWVALAVVPIVMAVAGLLIERFALRHLIGREILEVALATFGVALVLEHLIIDRWGRRDLGLRAPAGLDGVTSVFGRPYPTYRLFVLIVGYTSMAALIVWLRRSQIGLHVRAASHDRETTSMMGVDIDRVSAVVVAMSVALAGLAGVMAGPYLSLSPGMGTDILIPSLIVVVIGGLGSIPGAMVAALGLGLLQTFGASLPSTVAQFLPYLALIVVLAVRPQGLGGRRVA